MTAYLRILAAAFVLLPACAMAQTVPEQHVMRDVTIISYDPMPPDSGIFHFLRRMVVADGQGERHDIQITWGRQDQEVPPVGAVCDITWQEREVRNVIISPQSKTYKWLVSFTCKP